MLRCTSKQHGPTGDRNPKHKAARLMKNDDEPLPELAAALNRVLHKIWFFRFFGPGSGGFGGPGRSPKAFRGLSRGLRGPTEGLEDLTQTRTNKLETYKF